MRGVALVMFIFFFGIPVGFLPGFYLKA